MQMEAVDFSMPATMFVKCGLQRTVKGGRALKYPLATIESFLF